MKSINFFKLMRYGIFADIHSNLEAFESVIDAYKKEAIDQYICLGDIVGYAANPCECIELVKKLNPLLIAGNHDWAVIDKLELEWFNDNAKEALIWTKDVLNEEEKNFLSDLRLTLDIDDFSLVHSSLNKPQEFEYLDDYQKLYTTFTLLKKNILFVGHTHKPGVYIFSEDKIGYTQAERLELSADNRYIINVGSVGQPRDKDERACFCIYDTKERLVQIKRIDYDIQLAQRKIKEVGLPSFFATRLSVGG